MKAKPKYKLKKYVSGVQTLNPNADPTLQYQTNRGQTAKDMQFNNSQQSLQNRDLQKVQASDTANQSIQDLNNVSSSTKGARNTASGIASAFGPVGMVVGAGINIAGGVGDSLNKKVADKELAGGKRDYATRGVANVIDPTTNLIQGLGLDGSGMNGSDLVSGLTAGLVNLKGSKEDKAIDEAKYQKSRLNYTNDQIKKYGNIDTNQQAVQAKNGKKNIKYTYKKEAGVREIESEGREPIFSPKKKNGTRDLLYYKPTDPTHAQGGVKINVVPKTSYKLKDNSKLTIPEGSAIVTAKEGKNKEAVKAYKQKDYKKLDKVINKMPEDGKDKKAFGVSILDQNEKPKKLGYGFTDKDGNDYSNLNAVDSTGAKKEPEIKGDKSKTNLDFLAGSASSAYNLGQGLFGKVNKTNRRYTNPEAYKYQDFSGTNRRATDEQYRVESDNIRNATGGSGGTFLANQSLASANRFKNISDINNQESAKRLDIQNTNTGLRNQTQQTNLDLSNQYDTMDAQNRGKKSEFLGKGLEGLDALTQSAVLNKNRSKSDDVKLNLMKTGNYKTDSEGNITSIKAKGTKAIKYKMKK